MASSTSSIVGDGLLDRFTSARVRAGVAQLFDIALGVLMLVISTPLMILVAVAIHLGDGGPVFYRQTRIGFRGLPFEMLKFRSMRVDAEADGVERWASVSDDRVTSIGRLIRNTHLDELPQLFNVVKSEMRVVGPRPERPCFVRLLTDELPRYQRRHLLKPGITGWAQVRYRYASSVDDTARKLEYDLYYIDHHGFVLDLRILLETIWVALTMRGAR